MATCTQCGQYVTPEIGCVCIGDKDDQVDMFGEEVEPMEKKR